MGRTLRRHGIGWYRQMRAQPIKIGRMTDFILRYALEIGQSRWCQLLL